MGFPIGCWNTKVGRVADSRQRGAAFTGSADVTMQRFEGSVVLGLSQALKAVTMNIEEYFSRTYPLSNDKVLEMMKRDSGAIGNVVRGLSNKCFGLAAEIKEHDTMDFFCITSRHPQPGLLLRLKFREPRFYDYLLAFSMDCEREYPFLQALDVYRAFIFYLRQHLESNGYQTVETREIDALGTAGGTFVGAFPMEVIPSINKTSYFRDILGYEDIEFNGSTRYVYLMFDARNDYFKIGESRRPRYRERTLQAKEPEVEILKVWDCDHRIERMLHRKFADKRVRKDRPRSEWFRLHIGDLMGLSATIERMQAELSGRIEGGDSFPTAADSL